MQVSTTPESRFPDARIFTLQYILGHSDMSITMNVYTHAQYDNVKKEIEDMEQQQAM